MIIAGAPTVKVCLTSLFFWNPGRGSVLINAHHVFFSTFALSWFYFFFKDFVFSFFSFFCIHFWNMSAWCDISTSPIVYDLIYLCVALLGVFVGLCVFLFVLCRGAVSRWRAIVDHLFVNAACWCYSCAPSLKYWTVWQLLSLGHLNR